MVTTRASKRKLKESEEAEVEKLENKRNKFFGDTETKEGKMERASKRKGERTEESGTRKRDKNEDNVEKKEKKQHREKGREEGRRKRKLDKEKDTEETEEIKRVWKILENKIKLCKGKQLSFSETNILLFDLEVLRFRVPEIGCDPEYIWEYASAKYLVRCNEITLRSVRQMLIRPPLDEVHPSKYPIKNGHPTKEDWKNASFFKDECDKIIYQEINNSILVGFNSSRWDDIAIRKAFQHYYLGSPIPVATLDLYSWISQHLRVPSCNSLKNLAEHFHTKKPTHRSLGDVKSTMEVFKTFCVEMKFHNIELELFRNLKIFEGWGNKKKKKSKDKKRRSAKEEAKKIEEAETEKKNLKLFIAKLIEDSVGQTNDLGCAWSALAGGSYDREFKERMKQAIRSLCLENPESYSFIASDNIMGELLWLAAIFRRILLVQKWDSEIVDLVRTAAHKATDRLVYEVKEISKILDLASGIHSETWNDSSQVWNDESRGKVKELMRYIDWWMVNSGSLKESLDSWLKNSEGEIFESCKVVVICFYVHLIP